MFYRSESIYCEEIRKTKNGNCASAEAAIICKKAKFWTRIFSWKKKSKTNEERVGLLSLFRFASKKDVLFLFTGILASILSGFIGPCYMIVLGNAINVFTDRTSNLCTYNLTSISQQYCPSNLVLTTTNFYENIHLCNYTDANLGNETYDLKSKIKRPMMIILCIGVICAITSYTSAVCLKILSERQNRRIRQTLFRSIFEKNFVFLDKHRTGEFGLHLSETIEKITGGIGEKFGVAIESIATFIACLFISFSTSWKLSLVLFSLAPIIFLTLGILFKIVSKMAVTERLANTKASAVAEEVISAIRTVLSLNGQDKEKQRYETHLSDARKCGVKKGLASGIAIGISFLVRFTIFALGYWYGAKLAREEGYSIGDIFTTFMTIYTGIFAISEATPFFDAIFGARIAAFILWKIIDDPSIVDKRLETGVTKEKFLGDIKFSNIHFTYPSRPDQTILNNVSFDVKRGQTIALVGSSGSGKSTCFQLLQRFYNPTSGSILIDETPIDEYNLTWLRQHIGVVSQEPALFHTTIRENILFGRPSATDEEIHRAAKMANAHDFIMTLPDKYETEVGERGGALSGGQRQRIAIARALLHDPKILILDEATSALDNESEKIVQRALDRAAEGRTTLIIAHRLSTIQNADKIIVMQKGVVVEEGNHETLMKDKGVYYNLVQQQKNHDAEEQEDLAFEQQQILKVLFSQQSVASYVEGYARQCTVLSLEPTIKATLFGGSDRDTFDTENEIDEELSKKNKERKHTSRSLLSMNRPEWCFILFGCIIAAINGATIPSASIFDVKLTTAFQECSFAEQQRKITTYCWIYLCFGFLNFLCNSIQGWLFAYSGEAVTKRIRSKAFQAILRQEIAYFDEPNHSPGALCSRLANDGAAVQGATGVRFGLICQQLVLLASGVAIAFAYSWRLSLYVVCFVPLLVSGGILEIRIAGRLARKSREAIEKSGKVRRKTKHKEFQLHSIHCL